MKATIRKKIIETRNRCSDEDIIKNSKKIKTKLFSLKEFKKAKTVMFFVSFGKEVNTHEMIKQALNNKTVAVPVVKNNKLLISKIDRFEDLDKLNKYKIPEPSKIKGVDISDIDLVIVPGVAFDCEGYRVGYGKGYYDRFLNDFEKLKIALAFECQIVKVCPKEDHDVIVDKIITEKRVIKCDQLVYWDV